MNSFSNYKQRITFFFKIHMKSYQELTVSLLDKIQRNQAFVRDSNFKELNPSFFLRSFFIWNVYTKKGFFPSRVLCKVLLTARLCKDLLKGKKRVKRNTIVPHFKWKEKRMVSKIHFKLESHLSCTAIWIEQGFYSFWEDH